MVSDVSEEATALPNKPIVSDMTVSSKESVKTTDEGRDENTQRDEGQSEREESSSDAQKKTSKSSSTAAARNNKGAKSKGGRYQYPNTLNNNNNNNMGQGQRGPFPMSRGGPPYAPPPYYHGHGSSYGPGPGGPPHGPPPQYHPHHPHIMPPYGGFIQSGGPPPPRTGGYPPPPYGAPPYSLPPYGMPPSYHNNSSNINTSDSASMGSVGSKGSTKKRTIDGVHGTALPSAYTFRRTESNTSTTSTVTTGNNTSGELSSQMLTEESPQKRERSTETPPLNMGGLSFDEQHPPQGKKQDKQYHRRDFSAASTASSLSVGGFSLSSYEGPRVGAVEDQAMMNSSLLNSSPKRRKAEGREHLHVDTEMRPPSTTSNSAEADHSSRFEQLSIDAAKMPSSNSSSSSAGQHRNLFLSLSTSSINHDVDATPISKNTAKQKQPEKGETKKTASIFKPKGGVAQPKIDTTASDPDRPSDTPTPPVHGEVGSSMTEEHSMLNHHLRGQTFTPLPHLSSNVSSSNSPSAAAFASAIAPQLSWSIAGDTPSLGDLAEWDEDHKLHKTDHKPRPGSATSVDTRNMMISPHDFQFWKEEQEIADTAMSGTTTPLPVFFEQSTNDGAENHTRFDQGAKKQGEPDQGHHQMFPTGSRHPGQGLKLSNKPTGSHLGWPKQHDPSTDKITLGMPPTPMFASSDFREDIFGPRSPMGGDRREGMEFYAAYPHPGAPHDRVRNLRGRVPPGAHLPPMPLHIPPPMSAHLPMTSPMGLGPKAGLWSPHHHNGMPPPLASPHHMGSPLGNMAQSKRKCVPLKPPIPSKYQGDIEKAKTAQVPEFTSLVNFPAHMSQKQSVNLPEGMRCCVMCGQACPCSTGNKNKKLKKQGADGSLAPRSANGQDQMGDKNSGYAIIPTQNKGLCTLCDVNVWVVVCSGLEIKWCKGCKNFRPWAAFGDKGLATKCLRCRERQREKYALQKVEKERARLNATKAKK